MKVLDAVESVLKEAGAQLNYEAITKQILEKGLWTAQGAIEEANRADATPVALMNGEQLVKLLVENDIGIRRTPADLIELGDGEDEV